MSKEHDVIYLAPLDPEWDEVEAEDDRHWCLDGDVWDAPGVKYIRAELAEAEASRMRAALTNIVSVLRGQNGAVAAAIRSMAQLGLQDSPAGAPR